MVISVTTTMTTMTTVAVATTTVKWKVEGKDGVCHAEHRNRAGCLAYTKNYRVLCLVPAPPCFLNAWNCSIAIVVSKLVLGLPTYGMNG
jgi:hypothetical protein